MSYGDRAIRQTGGAADRTDWTTRNKVSGQIIHSYISGSCLYNHGLRREKTCPWWFANNKGVDQPAHPHGLISVFADLG